MRKLQKFPSWKVINDVKIAQCNTTTVLMNVSTTTLVETLLQWFGKYCWTTSLNHTTWNIGFITFYIFRNCCFSCCCCCKCTKITCENIWNVGELLCATFLKVSTTDAPLPIMIWEKVNIQEYLCVEIISKWQSMTNLNCSSRFFSHIFTKYLCMSSKYNYVCSIRVI